MTLSKMGIYETRHKCHSVLQNCYYAGCDYSECRVFFVVMLSVVMLNVIMLNVVMLNVVMLNVVAPSEAQIIFVAKRTMLNVPKPYISTPLAGNC
jgi:hypothetical protein